MCFDVLNVIVFVFYTYFVCLSSNFSYVRSFRPRPLERNVTCNVVWSDSRQDTKKTNIAAYKYSQENDSYFYKDTETSRA